MIQVYYSELDFFFWTLRSLMLKRGIDGVIARKEIIKEGNREYEPGLGSRNGGIKSSTDRIIRYFREMGFIEKIGIGQYKVIKQIPDKYNNLKEMRVDYPPQYETDRDRKRKDNRAKACRTY